jgi:hypothetical protein
MLSNQPRNNLSYVGYVVASEVVGGGGGFILYSHAVFLWAKGVSFLAFPASLEEQQSDEIHVCCKLQ